MERVEKQDADARKMKRVIAQHAERIAHDVEMHPYRERARTSTRIQAYLREFLRDVEFQ